MHLPGGEGTPDLGVKIESLLPIGTFLSLVRTVTVSSRTYRTDLTLACSRVPCGLFATHPLMQLAHAPTLDAVLSSVTITAAEGARKALVRGRHRGGRDLAGSAEVDWEPLGRTGTGLKRGRRVPWKGPL